MGIQEFFSHDIVKRSSLFIAIMLILQFFFSFSDKMHQFPVSASPLYTTDLLASTILVSVLLSVYSWDKIKGVGFHKAHASSFFAGSSSMALFMIYYLFKVSDLVHNHLAYLLRYLLIFSASSLLFIAVFGWSNIRCVLSRSRCFFLLPFGSACVYFLLLFFRKLAFPLSALSVDILRRYFSLNHDVFLLDNLIRVDSFAVTIAEQCSGIESILLFLLLFSFIWLIEREHVHHLRMLFLLFTGILSVISLNILRLIFLVHIGLVDRQSALGLFHSNISWMLFIAYFFMFWRFSASFVRKTI